MRDRKQLERSSTVHRKRTLVVLSYRFLRRGERYLPPFVRGLLGVALMICGIFGFLPIIGFWMFPLGVGLLATDIPPLRRWFIKRLNTSRHKLR